MMTSFSECAEAANPNSQPQWSILVYQYGLLDPVDWDHDCYEHLLLQNRFWNALVEIEREHQKGRRELLAMDEVYAAVRAQLADRYVEQSELRTERSKLRRAARQKLDTPVLDERLRDVSREIQRLSALAKAAASCASNRADINACLKQLDKHSTALRKDARHDSGLWWGNYNAVWRSFREARTRACKNGGEVRFHGFCAEGRYTVQIVGGASAQAILTDSRSQAWIDQTLMPVPWRANKAPRAPRLSRKGLLIGATPGRVGRARPRLSITIYTHGRLRAQRRMLTFPLIYDRPLPSAARIQEIIVCRRRIGTRFRYHASFLMRVPYVPPPVHPSSEICGINFGFRSRADGSLRVAVLADESGAREYVLPAKWMREMDYVETIRQRRDLSVDAMAKVLREQWATRPEGAPEELAECIGNLLRSPRFGTRGLARGVLTWRAYPHYWPDLYSRLEAWRREDRHRLEFEANKRERLMMQRREIYRLLARDIARQYGRIQVGEVSLQKLATLVMFDGSDTELPERVRRNRTRASLSRLRQELAHQANKSGSVILSVAGVYTRRCHQCGNECAVTVDLMHCCEHCSAIWDQDENAAHNTRTAVVEQVPVSENDASTWNVNPIATARSS